MKGSSSFLIGLGLGVVAVAAGYLALRNMPAPEPTAEEIRDRLVFNLDNAPVKLPRALPEAVLTRSCAFGPTLVEAQRSTVKPVAKPGGEAPVDDGATYDHPTPESRLHAILDATTCRELGALEGVNTEDLSDIARSSPLLVRRAWNNGDAVSARAWAVRTWALGQDLMAADPNRTELGSELVAAGADGLAFWLVQQDVPEDVRKEGTVLAMALLSTSPPASILVEQRATRMLRRGLSSPVALNLDAKGLTAAFEAAGAWWGGVSEAMDTPGAPVPGPAERPPDSTRDTVDVLAAMTDHGLEDWFTSVRAADRGRLAVTLLLNLDRTTCATPWQGDPPKDPVTGEPAGWDVDSCTLTLGDQQWGRQVAVPEEDFGRTDGKRFGPPD